METANNNGSDDLRTFADWGTPDHQAITPLPYIRLRFRNNGSRVFTPAGPPDYQEITSPSEMRIRTKEEIQKYQADNEELLRITREENKTCMQQLEKCVNERIALFRETSGLSSSKIPSAISEFAQSQTSSNTKEREEDPCNEEVPEILPQILA